MDGFMNRHELRDHAACLDGLANAADDFAHLFGVELLVPRFRAAAVQPATDDDFREWLRPRPKPEPLAPWSDAVVPDSHEEHLLKVLDAMAAAELVPVPNVSPDRVPVADSIPEPAPVAASPEPVPVVKPEPKPAAKPAAKSGYAPPAPGTKGGAWTEAEDALIVAEVLAHPERSVNATAMALSGVFPDKGPLDRTAGSIVTRVNAVLGKRIEAAKAEAAKSPATPAVSEPIDTPPTAPAVEKVAEIPAQAMPADLPAGTPRQRTIRAGLRALGHSAPWTPALDLALCEGLWGGSKLPMVAADLGIDTDLAKRRFAAITTAAKDGADFLPLDAQKDLLIELRLAVKA